MQATTQLNRQGRGCGYEPAPPPGIAVTPWQPPMYPIVKLGYRHERPKVCAGYTTRLPEIAEAARARSWALRGQLGVFLGGERANENLLAYIDILDAEVNAVEVWAVTPRDKGGGRE